MDVALPSPGQPEDETGQIFDRRDLDSRIAGRAAGRAAAGRDEGAREPKLGGLLQPGLALADRTNFAGKPDFPDDDRIAFTHGGHDLVAATRFELRAAWSEVTGLMQALREKGANVPEICEKLEVSYVLVNQLILQSYKLVIDSEQVFERQEKMRLGIE